MNAKQITVKSGSNFLWAFLGLSRPQKQALYALYAFCRTVDDIVDETSDPKKAQEELDHWKRSLDRIQSPTMFDPPLAHELSKAVKAFGIETDDLRWIIQGVEMDLNHKRYETFDSLLEYCDAVASAVGFASLAIFGADRLRTADYAYATGRALQLTNILRDVAVDAEKGRIYLPHEDLDRFGYRERDLKMSIHNQNFVELMRFEVSRAKGFFAAAAESLPKNDRKRLPAAEIMRRTYELLLRRIEQKNFNVFPRKIRVPSRQKLAIAVSIWAPRILHAA